MNLEGRLGDLLVNQEGGAAARRRVGWCWWVLVGGCGGGVAGWVVWTGFGWLVGRATGRTPLFKVLVGGWGGRQDGPLCLRFWWVGGAGDRTDPSFLVNRLGLDLGTRRCVCVCQSVCLSACLPACLPACLCRVPSLWTPCRVSACLPGIFSWSPVAGSSGEAVGDVVLPPWAEGPEDFLAKLRQARRGGGGGFLAELCQARVCAARPSVVCLGRERKSLSGVIGGTGCGGADASRELRNSSREAARRE